MVRIRQPMRRIIGFFLYACASLLEAEADSFRVWKSDVGTEIEAQLIANYEGSVILERRDGSRVSVALERLDEKTQEMLKGLHPVAAANEPLGADLPALKTGPWTGFHAVYQEDRFDAFLRRNGSLHILPKNKGKPILGPYPIVLRPELHYKTETGWRQRVIKQLLTTQPAQTQPQEIAYTGRTEEGVEFHFHLEFKANRVLAWGYLKDPTGLPNPTEFQIRVQVVRTHPLNDDASEAQARAAVADSAVLVKTDKGEASLPLFEPITLQKQANLRAPSHVSIRSNSWPERKIHIKGPEAREGQIWLWNYPGQRLFQGFSASFHKAASGADSSRSALEILIE